MNYIGGIMKNTKNNLLLLFLTVIIGALIIFSANAKEGALYGITIAEKIIVPSLLPLLILFNFITVSKISAPIEKLFAPVTEKFFRLPRCTAGAIIFGLLGGYPTGTVLTNSLLENNDIDKATAKRLLLFNINGGAAFIINAVGFSMLNSQKAGIILFSSTTLSAVFIAVITGLFHKAPQKTESSYYNDSPADALNISVQNSISAVLNISAFIIFFSALNSIINPPEILLPIFEITFGISHNAKSLSLPEIAFFLAFSGFCIHLQLLPYIIKTGLKYSEFLIFRILHGGLSFAICKIILLIFPDEAEVFSNYTEKIFEISSVNLTFSVLMILGFIVLLFEIENRKKRNI